MALSCTIFEIWIICYAICYGIEKYRDLEVLRRGHSPCEFMRDLYIAKSTRPDAIFLPLILILVYLYPLLHSEPQKNKVKTVRWCVQLIQGHLTWYQSKAHARVRDFLFAFHRTYVSIFYRFKDITIYW